MNVKVRSQRTGLVRTVNVERAVSWARADLKKAWDILSELTAGGRFMSSWRPKSDAEKIALMYQEISDTMDCLRKRSPRSPKMKEWMCEEVALADLVIRIMQFSYIHKLRIPEAIMARILMYGNRLSEEKTDGEE